MNWEEKFLEEIESIAAKHNMKEHRAFLFWYIKATDTDDRSDEDILSNCIVDRSNDAAGDAILISHKQKIIKIIQSKFTRAINQNAFNKDELTKVTKINDYIEGHSDYSKLRQYVHAKMKDILDDAVRYVKDSGYSVKLIFITTNKNNPNQRIYNDHEIEIVAGGKIQRLFEEWERGHTPELGEISFSYLDIMEGPREPRSYIVHFNTDTIRQAYLKWKEKLFSKNVRIFYGYSKKANVSMKKTLIDQPTSFWYFNNGVTILSNRVSLDSKSKKISLQDPQIINGCQTITTIGDNKLSESTILAKIIEIGDTEVNQDFIDGIIEANNRQTPVDERILKSNHPLQVKLDRDLREWGYYYERKEGSYRIEKVKDVTIRRLEKIDNKELLQANFCLVRPPHMSLLDENDLFSTYYNDVFRTDKTVADYLIPHLIHKKIWHIANNYHAGTRNSFYKLASFHITRIVFDFCEELRNAKTMHDLRRDLEEGRKQLDGRTIKELLNLIYKLYKKSDYVEKYAGQRDYFKSAQTYQEIKDAIPKWLMRNLEGIIVDN